MDTDMTGLWTETLQVGGPANYHQLQRRSKANPRIRFLSGIKPIPNILRKSWEQQSLLVGLLESNMEYPLFCVGAQDISNHWAAKMAQRAKGLATKPNYPRLSSRTYLMEEET